MEIYAGILLFIISLFLIPLFLMLIMGLIAVADFLIDILETSFRKFR